ncbi:MAG: hypothetical protein ABIF17_01270 [Patescibacteria group bacterium]
MKNNDGVVCLETAKFLAAEGNEKTLSSLSEWMSQKRHLDLSGEEITACIARQAGKGLLLQIIYSDL